MKKGPPDRGGPAGETPTKGDVTGRPLTRTCPEMGVGRRPGPGGEAPAPPPGDPASGGTAPA